MIVLQGNSTYITRIFAPLQTQSSYPLHYSICSFSSNQLLSHRHHLHTASHPISFYRIAIIFTQLLIQSASIASPSSSQTSRMRTAQHQSFIEFQDISIHPIREAFLFSTPPIKIFHMIR
ncbi:hypothetical protein AMTR_s00040p00088950 [Amborella trichopoda]|uniref:Uncharacterized protein n=1 Tax=Amborella trichopoda TaxID=13333 RepID=W1PYG9_AMBTC|nr:hypothetical protein AMTR_s00040p00088950 [Amborella trichopoda]